MINPKPEKKNKQKKNKDLATSPEVRVVVETLFFVIHGLGLIMIDLD